MKLEAVVYSDRSYVGELTIANSDVPPISIAAKSADSLGVADPPLGKYKLKKLAPIPRNDQDALALYGPYILYFEADRGAANKEILAIHGGQTDVDGSLLPTEGSIRIANYDLVRLAGLVSTSEPVTLEIVEQKIGFFKRAFTSKLSTNQPQLIQQRTEIRSADSNDFWFWMWYYDRPHYRYDDRNPDYTPSAHFIAGGGDSAGGGASGSFAPYTDIDTKPAPVVATAAVDPDVPLIIDPFRDDRSRDSGQTESRAPDTNKADDAQSGSVLESFGIRSDFGVRSSGDDTPGPVVEVGSGPGTSY